MYFKYRIPKMKKSISLNDLNLFVNVVQAGSLTKASEQLSIPMATISRRLTQLEESIGEHLLNRSTRSVSMTSLGQMYFDQCVNPLTECMMAVNHLNDTHYQLSGTIKVTAPINLTHKWLSNCIFSFMKQYPDIKIDLMVTNRIVDLTALSIDVAIRVGNLDDSNWVAKKLFFSKNILCASPKYLVSNSVPIHPVDLKNHRLICSNVSNGWTLQNTQTQELYIADMPFNFIVDDIQLMINASKQDLGICFVSEQFVHDEIQNGELIPILTEWVGIPRPVYVMVRDRCYIPNRVKIFKQYIEQYIKDENVNYQI